MAHSNVDLEVLPERLRAFAIGIDVFYDTELDIGSNNTLLSMAMHWFSCISVPAILSRLLARHFHSHSISTSSALWIYFYEYF